MATETLEKNCKHLGDTAAMANHDRDLVKELADHVDKVWRLDQYEANAEGHDELAKFWRDLKEQELENIDRMRSLVRKEIEQNCF